MFSQTAFTNQAKKLLQKAGITINGKHSWDIQMYDASIFADVFFKGSLGLADGYMNKKWDVDQIDVFFEKLLLSQADFSPNFSALLFRSRDTFMNTQIGRRAFHVAQKHYDLGNTMYEYMLGKSMVYSCALFTKDTDDLTQAQYNKLDALCQKLNLKKGMKILEIGSGWGSFAKHAAVHYGVEVLGLTVSVEQKEYAEKLCKGLPVNFLLKDYRNLENKYTQYFDRVVSIEMIEAVGKKNLGTYFEIIERVLKNDGIVGLQSILGDGGEDVFLSTRIFPNGHVPSTKEIASNSKGLLRIKHWESFGRDYEKTLLCWEKNFRKEWKNITALNNKNKQNNYDEKFYRMWRYYLLLCAAIFRVGKNDVAQIILSKENSLSGLK